LGRTVDAGRVWDVIAAAKYLASPDSPASPDDPKKLTVHVAGKGPAGLIAAYAAALDESIADVTIVDPPKTHMDAAAPQFLNVLRVCDVSDSLGLIAPRPLTLIEADAADFKRTAAAYASADASSNLTIKP
jgi:threonine dehydrogenase-like Zn-dependent dehydrogenase